MKKKIFFILFIFIIILILSLVIREIKISNENIYEKNMLSRNEIISFLDNGAKYNNYYRSIYTTKGHEEFYFKDNKLTHYIDNNLDYWMNLSENEKEMIQIENTNEKVANIVQNFDSIKFPTEYTQLGYYCTIYDEQNCKFKYLGITKLNERNTIVAKSVLTDGLCNNFEIKYYIDEKTGVIVKRKQIEKKFFLTIKVDEFDRDIKFDIVTDKDVEKPDLTNYEVYSGNFPELVIW